LSSVGVWRKGSPSGRVRLPVGAVPKLYWINVPLAAGSLVLVGTFAPESADPHATSHVDWPGLITIGLAVFALLYAPDRGPGCRLVVPPWS
jgi:hypothetical protein